MAVGRRATPRLLGFVGLWAALELVDGVARTGSDQSPTSMDSSSSLGFHSRHRSPVVYVPDRAPSHLRRRGALFLVRRREHLAHGSLAILGHLLVPVLPDQGLRRFRS